MRRQYIALLQLAALIVLMLWALAYWQSPGERFGDWDTLEMPPDPAYPAVIPHRARGKH